MEHPRGCQCGQCQHNRAQGGPNGRPLPWDSQQYNENTSPAIVYALGAVWFPMAREAATHPGFPPADLASEVTIQNYIVPAGQKRS